jgi:putative ABC transport system permease protein
VTDGLVVSPDYFQTMKIPLLQGRFFAEADRDGASPVAIIDREFSERHFPGDDPIGKRVKLSRDPDSSRPWLEIIGVVGNVKNLGVDRESREAIYRPYFQEAETYMTMVIESESAPEAVAAMVRQTVTRIDPDQPIYRIGSLDRYLADRMVPRRISSVTLVIFAALALLMASVGIYGLLAYAVSRRQQEIGIRMAMGAKAPDILRMILGQATRLAALGITIGLGISFLTTPLLADLLFGVDARDPITFLGIALLLGSVALVSAFLPARRAARVEPLAALRYE